MLTYRASREDVKEAMGKVRRMERLTKEALKVSAYPAFSKRTAKALPSHPGLHPHLHFRGRVQTDPLLPNRKGHGHHPRRRRDRQDQGAEKFVRENPAASVYIQATPSIGALGNLPKVVRGLKRTA